VSISPRYTPRPVAEFVSGHHHGTGEAGSPVTPANLLGVDGLDIETVDAQIGG
jgi:hypothetical protein